MILHAKSYCLAMQDGSFSYNNTSNFISE